MDDRDLFAGLIRLHVLHHAAEEPIYGLAMIEELARHGYRMSPGTLYPMLCVFRGSWTRVSREGGQVFRAKLDSRSAATQGVSVFTLTAGFRSN
jgi:PadR family transcriptional regulator PadR